MGKDQVGLRSAIDACKRATAPDRLVDALIAVAVFPALAALPAIAPGIWRREAGSHARALRYSGSRMAAATLVPGGCWMEGHGTGVRVCGAVREWTSEHEYEPLAICIGALRARLDVLSNT